LTKKTATIIIAVIALLAGITIPALLAHRPKCQQEAMVFRAQKYLDRDVYYFDISEVNWCVFFTCFVADKCGIGSPSDEPEAGLFPPCEESTWEENSWAATSIRKQIEWFTQKDKGTLYYFEDFEEITEGRNKYKVAMGDFEPLPGDLVYIDAPVEDGYLFDHVAIVRDFDPVSGRVSYIGGNQGDMDVTKSRVTIDEVFLDGRNDKNVAGFLRPNYETEYRSPEE